MKITCYDNFNLEIEAYQQYTGITKYSFTNLDRMLRGKGITTACKCKADMAFERKERYPDLINMRGSVIRNQALADR